MRHVFSNVFVLYGNREYDEAGDDDDDDDDAVNFYNA